MQYDFKFSEAASININIVRIIAAHLVVIGHGIMALFSPIGGGLLGAPGLGVFFAMSGILISYSTFRNMNKDDYDFKKFFVRRFSRIHPPLLLALIIMAIIDGFWFIYLGNPDPLNSYNIPTFLWNLLILQDSLWGPTCFGMSRQLWPFPLFWWTYLFFGWLILGMRTTKKKYLYGIILGFFSFILIFICLGPWTSNKIEYLSLWFYGVGFSFLINKLDNYIQKKNIQNKKIGEDKSIQLKKNVKNASFVIAIILFILAYIRLFTHQDPYGIICLLLLNSSFFFFIIVSQYSKKTYSVKVKKIVNFMADYTYSLFLIQYSAYYLLSLFIDVVAFAENSIPNKIIILVLMYLLSNLLAIVIAYFTELKHKKIYYFLLRKLHINSKSKETLDEKSNHIQEKIIAE